MLRNPEVGKHRSAGPAVNQYVVRLHVAVDDPHLMRVFQRAGELARDAARLVRVQPADALETRLERLAVDEAHQIVEQVASLAERVQGNDVRMGESRGRARFAQKPLARIAGELSRKHLDRHVAIQKWFVREIHGTHATPSEQPDDFVLRSQRRGERARLAIVRDGLHGRHLGCLG